MSQVSRVSGPLVEVTGSAGLAMAELVEVGEDRLPAEVVALNPDRAVLQAYEYTGALAPGAPAVALRRPLAGRLGPGLLGGVFDGLLRPLRGVGVWLRPGATAAGADGRDWEFRPEPGAAPVVGPGDRLGTVVGAGAVVHRVLVPPGVSGPVRLAPPGRYGPDEAVATVGRTDVPLSAWWPVRRPRPHAGRLDAVEPLLTGQRVLDAVFPTALGGTAAVPGGFGTGKTVLLQQIAKWCAADIIVYVGCGERGNEMADVVEELGRLPDPRAGGLLADRTVVIANTSNMPIMAREASIYTGVTVAEYYRDMGYHAVVIADSTSRWAEALREFASRTGALPAEEGYPAGLASALAAFYERAGAVSALGGGTASVTIVGAVSPPGGDLTEPVTAHTQRFVRAQWTLDRELAYARHYPAVTWTGSYSRDAPAIGAWYGRNGDPDWSVRRTRLITILAEADRVGALAELVGRAALPDRERVTLLAGRLVREAVLAQSSLSATDANCPAEVSAALAQAVLDVVGAAERVVDGGAPAQAVEECDFGPLLRAREDPGPDRVGAIRARRRQVLDRLGELG